MDAKARMISRNSIAWKLGDMTGNTAKLYYHPTGGIAITNDVIVPEGGTSFPLRFEGTIGETKTPNDNKLAYIAYLHNWARLALPNFAESTIDLPTLLQGQLVVGIKNAQGQLIEATAVQTAGVLDDLYAYSGRLGTVFYKTEVTLRLWAPTAKSVLLHLYQNSNASSEVIKSPFAMNRLMEGDQWTGVWEYTASQSELNEAYYLYELSVYVPSMGMIETNWVTDPYSHSLSVNSLFSQIIDLSTPHWKPDQWDNTTRPPLASPVDIVLYELHVRDFSISDATVTDAYQGKFKAFTEKTSNGICHLKELQAAGLTHVHLLPSFDFATVNEDASTRVEPQIPQAPAHSDKQQAAVTATQQTDGFNWGYDPLHYMVPEGSYSTNPDGPLRILEFREMVKVLHDCGLRVVMDVVFNHTHASGQDEQSVLDQIVPGYYYRLDDEGNVQHSTCRNDTASEHSMMEKLMIDSLILWVTEYQVDGFRFDLMGHHTTTNMRKVKSTLESIDPTIYCYGEAWKFGSLDAQTPELAAHQQNMGGLGIGSFNDRIRDSARGGTYFPSTEQGFISGLYDDFNGLETSAITTDKAQRKSLLLNHMDNIRIALAGNLKDYRFTGADGNIISGTDIVYRGASGAGYTAAPQENVNFVSAHDNLTLWDNLLAKAPFQVSGRTPPTISVAERVRMHNLGISLVALAQGVPFFHAGIEMLRSKSGDADSYDSGDHFNRLDFTYTNNNWAVGLAPKTVGDNSKHWEAIWKPRLLDPSLQITTSDILSTKAHFKEMLQIRRSSPLFRLRTKEEIINQVAFLNAEAGASQVPGLIVMAITDLGKLDKHYSKMVVFFNGAKDVVPFTHASLIDAGLTLHPVQQKSNDSRIVSASYDATTGTLRVPGRTTLVYTIADLSS